MAILVALGVLAIGIIVGLLFFLNEDPLFGFIAICAGFAVAIGAWVKIGERI